MKVMLVILAVWFGAGCLAAIMDWAARYMMGIGFGNNRYAIHCIGLDILGGILTCIVLLIPFISSIVSVVRNKK